MSTFAVISTKGGVAKSTLVVHVAVAAKDLALKADLLCRQRERAANKSDPDDGDLLNHAIVRPTAGAIMRSSSINLANCSG